MKIILGAGEQNWDGWTPTHREQLDLTDPSSFARYFGESRARRSCGKRASCLGQACFAGAAMK